jgi:serine/threonine protein kinase
MQGWEEPERTDLFRYLVRIDLQFRQRLDQMTFPIGDYYSHFPAYRHEIDAAVREASDITRGASTSTRMPEATETIELAPGDTIDDFQLLTRLGQGAFAVVYLASQRSMMRRVALKISRRGRDEPPTLGQLDHPNIVRVFGVTRLPDRQLQLLCMEYTSGGTLHDVVTRIRRTGRPPDTGAFLYETIQEALAGSEERCYPPASGKDAPWFRVVCDLGAQLADALAHAHAKGIRHRDVKPANVLLSPDGTPKLADFNIAFGAHVSEVSAAGYFGGTPAYMSPEQLEACKGLTGPELVDHRSDTYSLAIMLWELLTGKTPFHDRAHEFVTLIPVERRKKGLTDEAIASVSAPHFRGLRDVLCRCLQPDPQKRYQSAGELARDLRLSAKPRIQALFHPPSSPILNWICRHPLWATILISLLPNFVLSVANVLYDWYAIVQPLEAGQYYLRVMVWGKGMLYLAGTSFGIWKCFHVFLAMRGGGSPAAMQAARRDCLTLADLVFHITLACWVVSGLLFPLWMDHSGAQLNMAHYLIFFASHLLCGLISGNLVVFALGYLAVSVFYPRLLSGSLDREPLKRAHERLRRRLELYFLTAVAVPFISALALGFSLSRTAANDSYWPAFLFLGLLGTLVLILGTASKSRVRTNLEALDEFVDLSAGAS